MTEHSTSQHWAGGKMYTTQTTHYETGASKIVTRLGEGSLRGGLIINIVLRDNRGNSTTRRF
jgi:hypothetical protein